MNLARHALRGISLALFVSTLAGCVKEIKRPDETNLHEVVFHAGWDAETKTVLQEDGEVFWSPNDSITILSSATSGSTGYKFISTNTEPAAMTEFHGSIPEMQDKTAYYGVYPYDSNTFIEQDEKGDARIIVQIPSVQIAQENGFPQNTFFSIAKSHGNTLNFKNICGGIKFTVSSPDIKSVEFRANSKYSISLSGRVSVTLDENDTPSVSYINEPAYVIVNAPNGGYFEPGKYYYAVTLPFDEQSGFSITYHKDSSEATFFCNEFNVKRSVVKRVIAKDEGLEFKASYKKAFLRWYSCQDPDKVTEILFHVNTEKNTGECFEFGDGIYSYSIYGELLGTTYHFYTKADKYVLCSGFRFGMHQNLESLDVSNLDTSDLSSFGQMFFGCKNLRYLDLSNFDTSNATDMQGMFWGCKSLENVNLSSFNTSNVEQMGSMFQECEKLTSLDLSHFNTSKVQDMGSMFAFCKSLRSLDISNFSSESMTGGLTGFLSRCFNLTKLNMGAFDISGFYNLDLCPQLAAYSKNCGILCSSETKEALLSGETKLSRTAKYITWFTPGQSLPDFEPVIDTNLYYSTDFSKDKVVKKLQSATQGKGIDLVIMGDAYSDRMIADGTYDHDMEAAMEAIFAREPYKTFRNLFNVYQIYAVSVNEVPAENTVFEYYNYDDRDSPSGGLGLRNEEAITEYVQVATSRASLKDDVGIIVLSNDENYGGVAVHAVSYNEYGITEGYSIAFTNKASMDVVFARTVSHEFGHSFTHFLDEYIRYLGLIDNWEKDSFTMMNDLFGWYSNIDFTSDPSAIKWHCMLEDPRYSGSGIGVYDGGATYALGAWRSTENSIMNDNITQDRFNAVCREAIYKRIHQLAYGDSWQYEYETFVNYDLPNIEEDKAEISTKSIGISATGRSRQKPLFRIEETQGANGSKKLTVIMD